MKDGRNKQISVAMKDAKTRSKIECLVEFNLKTKNKQKKHLKILIFYMKNVNALKNNAVLS